MKVKTIKGETVELVRQAFNNHVKQDFLPTLAIVLLSVKQDRVAISEILDKRGIAILGITTHGEFIDENSSNGSIAMMLFDMNPDYFQIYFEEYPDKNYREISSKIAREAKQKFKYPAFLLGTSDPTADGEEILRGLEEIAGTNVNAFGGAAGDDYAFENTFVFTNGKESCNGMVCLALDEEKISIQGIATCGWNAVGTEKTVTKSLGNHVYTIDNVAALDITTKYGGLENITPDNKDVLLEIAGNFPLQLQRDQGDPVMRPPLVVDWSDRSFYTSGTVPEGSKIRFSLPPDFDVMQKVVDGVEHLKNTKMPEADALIVFSCAGRLLSFGPMMVDEIEGVKKVWNVPMIGMFSNAELARATGGNLEMHNLTTCCVAIKERK